MFYNILPYRIKVFIISIYGYYLKNLRYGGKFHQYRDEAYERESWPKEKWDSWQEEKIAYILDTAIKHVPYYRAYWKRRKRGSRHQTGTVRINRRPTLRPFVRACSASVNG